MAYCLIHEASVSFKAYIRVVATPGSQVWATHVGTDRVFYPKNGAVTDSSGVAVIPVKKKGGYLVTSDASGTQTVEVAITRARETVAANVTGAFTLGISVNTVNSTAFATISVSRISSPFANAGTGALSNGAAVYYGDVLSASASPTTGFENATVVASGDISGSAGTYTVGGDCSLQGTATPKAFTITRTAKTINNRTAATVAVERMSSPFKGESTGTLSGNTVYHGDTLKFTSSNQNTSAYDVSAPTVSGASASNGIYTVNNANITATANAAVKSWTLTINAGANVTTTVSWSSSPYQGKSGTVASKKNGTATATIYYGDALSVSNSADSYYTASYSTSGSISSVSGAVTVTSSATRQTVAINFLRVTGTGTSTSRFKGSIPINKGESLSQSVGKSASGSYVANTGTTHTGTYSISQADAGSTTFKIYFINNDGNYSRTCEFSSSDIGNNSTAITSDQSFS